MLVERGLRVMNVEAVGDAYAIASNYLRRTGAIPDTFITNDRLLEIIVQMFHRGDFNRFASPTRQSRNSKRRSAFPVFNPDERRRGSWTPPSTASCKPTTFW